MSLDEIAARNARLAGQLADGLAGRAGAPLLTADDPRRRAGTITSRFRGRDGEAIAAELTRRGVIVSPRAGSTWFPMQFHNNSDDADRALAVLDEVPR